MYTVANLADKKVLIDSLFKFQESNKYSDSKMATSIGVARQTYSKVRNGNGNAEITASPEFLWNAMQFILNSNNGEIQSVDIQENIGGRRSSITRETAETNINLELNLDGTGICDIKNGVGMFDHLLSQLARHGKFDLKLKANGDDTHHIIEDVAICLGKAFRKALGEKRGIVRMANVTMPMDDALVTVAIDISGRGYAVLNTPLGNGDLSGLPADLVRHFLESFAIEAKMNLHASIIYGNNDHHKAEALFKALGRALDAATRIDERISGELPTTKGLLES
jgi:imidazoleglycerol-phosphate dehydratase